jgi:hypothetical protein
MTRTVATTLLAAIVATFVPSTDGEEPAQGRGSKLVEAVVSPRLSGANAASAQLAILKILQDVLKGGDSLIVTDADSLQRIISIDLSERIASAEEMYRKWKVQLYRAEITRLAAYFQQLKAATTSDRPALDIPAIMEVLGQRQSQFPDHERHVVLFGSPVYLDRLNTGFSMIEAFPSDGHLKSGVSPFSTLARSGRLAGTTVHVIHPPGDFYNDIHQQMLKRFWALWFGSQGAVLKTFSPDAAVWERVTASALPAITATYNPEDAKVQMYSVRRLPVDLWADLPATAPAPTAQSRGALIIGIRWKEASRGTDIDLYAGFKDNPEMLYFAHQQASFGRHLRDYRSGGDQYETIEFEGEVDIRQVRAAVNFYRGSFSGGARGEVRVVYSGQVYASSFAIPAERGNSGQVGSGEEDYWSVLDLPAIVRLVEVGR